MGIGAGPVTRYKRMRLARLRLARADQSRRAYPPVVVEEYQLRTDDAEGPIQLVLQIGRQPGADLVGRNLG